MSFKKVQMMKIMAKRGMKSKTIPKGVFKKLKISNAEKHKSGWF